MGLPESEWVSTALGMYFPGMQVFMPIFIFLLGYSTLIAFFHVGLKSMNYIIPNYGTIIYYTYSVAAFIIFSYADQSHALALMGVCGGLMLLFNLYVMFQLRDHVSA